MLKSCVYMLGQNRGSPNESRKNEEFIMDSVSFNLRSQSKDFSVRIVHAGGREELYPHEVPVSHLLEKYPGMFVARPDVFKNPQPSLLRADENLLPGQKYLIIPTSTARKLKRKQMVKTKVKGYGAGKDEVNMTWESGNDISDESVSSAKEFYTSKGRLTRDSKRTVRRIVKAKKPFVPPLPKTGILRGSVWEPSLTSVQELSP